MYGKVLIILMYFLIRDQIVMGNFILSSMRDCGNKDYNVRIKFSKLLRTPDRNPIINLNGTVKHNVNMNEVSLVVSVSRCRKLEAPDTCVTFRDFKTNHLCDVAFHPMYSVYSVLKCLNISTCDIKAGRYVGTECVLDTSQFNFVPLGSDFWKMSGDMYHKRTHAPMMCYTAILKGS